ncbi:MAG: hypothetical protein M3R13_05185 [Armatimonadota bacterium]|nr:hypothetical protein [Armatimonadota bacterium]
MTTICARSAAAAALLLPAIVAAQYNVEVLHSPAVPSVRSYGWGAGGGQQVGHTNIFLGGPSNALLWNGTAGSFVNLHPVGFDASYGMAADGGRQVGWREVHSPIAHAYATMWSGTAKSWTNLHNDAYLNTAATGIGGGQQVGVGNTTGSIYEALLWQGTPESVVNLHPAGDYRVSRADDTDGSQQVGTVETGPKGILHAALWSGTAGSFVDLHPEGYTHSEAYGVAIDQQVGWAATGGTTHAILWGGSSKSFVDLNPNIQPNWGSQALGTNGTQQAGFAALSVNGLPQLRATVWSGSRESIFDLHNMLPSQFIGVGAESRAMGIDEFGNIVGWAADLSDGGRAKAVLWRPVPEPGTGIAIATLMALFAIRKCEMTHRLRFGSRRRK